MMMNLGVEISACRDKDVYRRMTTTFGTVQNYFENRHYIGSVRDRRVLQPHHTSLTNLQAPFANSLHPEDGVCSHFLRRGLIKPNKTQMTAAVWSADARWLVLGTVSGDLALWEGDALKVIKLYLLCDALFCVFFFFFFGPVLSSLCFTFSIPTNLHILNIHPGTQDSLRSISQDIRRWRCGGQCPHHRNCLEQSWQFVGQW